MTLTNRRTLTNRQIEAEPQRSADLDAELIALRAEAAAAKAANTARPDDHDYDDATTRDLFIGPGLLNVSPTPNWDDLGVSGGQTGKRPMAWS